MRAVEYLLWGCYLRLTQSSDDQLSNPAANPGFTHAESFAGLSMVILIPWITMGWDSGLQICPVSQRK